MTPKEQAEKLYDDAYRRWCYELSHEKNVLTAKDIAIYMCKLILDKTDPPELSYMEPYSKSWWDEVIEQIKKLRK